MKHLVSGLILAAAVAGAAGCAEGPFSGDHKDHTSPMYSAGGSYHAYYDNHYGPIYDGYWSGDTFNYRTGANQPFQPDTGGHFRKDAASGFHEVHGELHPGAPGAPAPQP